jgi:hypothetical protein
VPEVQKTAHVEWVERHIGHALTPIEAELVNLLCMAFRWGPYNVGPGRRWVQCMSGNTGRAWFYVSMELATCDTDALSRLVVGAAERCLRLSVRPHGVGLIKVMVWQRVREGGLSTRAPAIEDVIASVRRWYDANDMGPGSSS